MSDQKASTISSCGPGLIVGQTGKLGQLTTQPWDWYCLNKASSKSVCPEKERGNELTWGQNNSIQSHCTIKWNCGELNITLLDDLQTCVASGSSSTSKLVRRMSVLPTELVLLSSVRLSPSQWTNICAAAEFGDMNCMSLKSNRVEVFHIILQQQFILKSVLGGSLQKKIRR